MNWLRALVIAAASILAAGCATGPSFNEMKSKIQSGLAFRTVDVLFLYVRAVNPP